MSSIVCQGLQSCLEPRVLRLKNTVIAAAAAANNNDKNGSDGCNVKSQNGANSNSGGWSFLQALTNSSNSPTNKEQETEKNDKAYVHPLVKRTSSKLSEKSLEMCTESLGSETGSTVVSSESRDSEIDLLSVDSGEGDCHTKQASKLQKLSPVAKKLSHCRSFPPPLTSISGSRGVQVKPHREGGRLVLKATAVPSSQSLFHAERGDGRLTLRLVTDFGPEQDGGEVQDQGIVQEEDEEVDQEEEGVQIGDDDGDDDEEQEEELEEISGNVGGEMGMGNLPRPSRCMESGRETGMRNWKPFWVAT